MSWPTIIPKIKDGETTFSAKDMNVIIQALEDRTTLLKQQIINDDIINGVGFSDIGLGSCKKGQFVAYSRKDHKYIPANPVWDNVSSVPSDEAYVIGLLISDVVEDQGTVLVSGILHNKSMIACIMGNMSHVPGHYYLSWNGGISQNLSDIAFPIHCGILTASNCFVLGIQIPDFRTHNHTCYRLSAKAWKSIDQATIDSPANARYFYDVSVDPTISTMLRTFISGTALVVNNQCLLEYKDYVISDGYIWLLKEFEQPMEGALYTTNPFIGISPWLTSMTVADENNILKVKQIGTTAVLDTDFKTTGIQNNGKAISNISRNGITECNVVNNIVGGAGVQITENYGTYTISSTSTLPKVLDFSIINGNGIILGGNDIILVKFPKSRQSSVNGTVRIPQGVNNAKARLFMCVEGIGATLSSGSILLKNISIPDNMTDIMKPTVPVNLKFNPLATPDTTKLYLWQSESTVDVISGDQLNITIYFDNPTNTISVCSIGVYLEYV